jgi:hypothetical protein
MKNCFLKSVLLVGLLVLGLAPVGKSASFVTTPNGLLTFSFADMSGVGVIGDSFTFSGSIYNSSTVDTYDITSFMAPFYGPYVTVAPLLPTSGPASQLLPGDTVTLDFFKATIVGGPNHTYANNLTVNTMQEVEPWHQESVSTANFSITVVPEPYQFGLIAVVGMMGMGVYHRFSRKMA